MGAEVTGVCSTSKLDYVRGLGAAHVIDYTREDITTGDRTYDAIIDLAGSRSVSALRRALAPTGTLVILGGEGGGKWLGMGRQVWSQIIGIATRQKFRSPIALVKQQDLRVLEEMLEAGTLRPVVDRRYPLRDVPTAIRALAAGHSRGKAVITVS
jgi:NADPH:quinone reductase-like Zn-dependent oxidoreductase